MIILQTPTFVNQSKKLHQNQKQDLDKVIKQIVKDPLLGEAKKGDLSTIRVYKFKMNKQLTLLAYKISNNNIELILIAFGSHENFYRNLKK